MKPIRPASAVELEAWLDHAISVAGPTLFATLVELSSHDDPEIRSTVAFGFGELHDQRAIEPLIRMVDHDESEAVRDEALRALDSYRDARIHDCLIREVARPKRSRPPRQNVARQLRAYPGARTVEALELLLEDPDELVRSDAHESLRLLAAAHHP